MAKVENPGHYMCPRCNGQEFYESEETTGAYAMTLDTPGPVDPTIVNRITGVVVRCVNCREKARWIDSPEALAEKSRVESVQYAWVGFVFGFVFLILGLYIAGEDIDGTSGLMYGSFAGSALMFFVGYRGYKSAEAKSKK